MISTISRRKLLCALAAASLVPFSGAQQSKPSPDLAGIAHVALRVTNLDASVAFYQKLGFVKAFELSRDGKVYEAFIKINDRQFVELYPVDAKNTQVGFLHLCFEGADLNAAHDYYVAQGLKPNAVKTAGAGNLLFTMPGPATPQGPQNMEYTQYMPGSLHSKDFGQHLGPDRIAQHLVRVTLATNDPEAARQFYLDKAGFLPKGKSMAALPGAHGEWLAFVPATALGFRARITFLVDPAKAPATLKERGIASTKVGPELLVVDPDGNEIVLAPPPPERAD